MRSVMSCSVIRAAMIASEVPVNPLQYRKLSSSYGQQNQAMVDGDNLKFHFFEHRGRTLLFKIYSLPHLSHCATYQIFEPLISETPLADWHAEIKFLHSTDGNVYLVFAGSKIDVFSLFNKAER